MSGVPKSKRGQSSVEYVWQAQILFHQTFECALRLPKRWTFYISERMVGHAEQVLHHAKSANSIYVSCAVDAQLRRLHLQQRRVRSTPARLGSCIRVRSSRS